MTLLLTHADSPFIRAIGFLYLRYVGDPKCVYKWIEPYLYDDEPIEARASSAKQNGSSETMGEYVRRLFTDKNYHGTILPRLPVQIERDIQVKLLQAEKIEQRAKKHVSDSRAMSCFQKLGAKVMALYGDEENPVQWYEAVVDRVITTDPETMQHLRHPKFVVTFPEYGNTETVTLGEMEMLGAQLDKVVAEQPQRGGYSDRDSQRTGNRDHGRGNSARSGSGHDDRSRGYGDRGYSGGYSNPNPRDEGYGDRGRDYSRGHRDDTWQSRGPLAPTTPLANEADLYEEVRRRERETVTSSGRNAIARRPPSTNASLLVPSSDGGSRQSYSRQASPPPLAQGEKPRNADSSNADHAPVKRKSAEELAAIQAKKRKLIAKYG